MSSIDKNLTSIVQVRQFTNLVAHYGNTSTSRIEGNHAVLKSYLRKSTGDMKSVFDRFQLYWKNQHETMVDQLANEKIRPLHSIQITLLAGVIGYVHSFALRKIVAQKARIDPDQPPLLPCTCGTPTYMGIPCWHILWDRIQGGGMVLSSDIHAHWFYNREDGTEIPAGRQVIPLLNNPAVVKGKGRPKGALGKRKCFIVPGPGPEVMAEIATAMRGGRGRGGRWGRGTGSRNAVNSSLPSTSHKAGYGGSSTRRHPSAFEIDPYKFPSSTAPPRLQNKRPATIDISSDESSTSSDWDDVTEENTIVVEGSTTQAALLRGAGRDDDYIPGTVRERAYMRSKTTITEKDIEDKTPDELADNWHDIDDFDPPTSTAALTRPKRSIAQKDWSYLNDDDNDELFEWE